jgi:hypothetical protein
MRFFAATVLIILAFMIVGSIDYSDALNQEARSQKVDSPTYTKTIKQ